MAARVEPPTDFGSRQALPALALFVMTAAFILTKTGRDALYVQQDGLSELPWTYIGIAVLAPVFAAAILSLIRSFGIRTARVISVASMAGLQLVIAVVAHPGGGPLMTSVFMLVPLIYGVLLSSTWLLGSELLETATEGHKARAYAVFGAASMAGGASGAALARTLSSLIEPQILFAAGAVGLLASTVVVAHAQRRFPLARTNKRGGGKRPHAGSMPPMREMAAHLAHPYIRSLLLVAAMAGFVGVIIEFLFFYSVAASDASGRENSTFFSNFYLTLTGASLVLQLTVTPLLQRLAGIRGSLLVLPLAVSVGAGSLLLPAAGLGYFGLRVIEGGVKSSVHRSNWEQTYGSLSQSQRSVVKVLIEGVGVRMAEGMAGSMILLWQYFLVAEQRYADPVALKLALVAAIALWIVATVAFFRSSPVLREIPTQPCDPSFSHPPDGCPITAALGTELVQSRQTTSATGRDRTG